jgi:hypothetical protein
MNSIHQNTLETSLTENEPEVTDALGGFQVIKRCKPCNGSVFVHNVKDREKAIRIVNDQFAKYHPDCK